MLSKGISAILPVSALSTHNSALGTQHSEDGWLHNPKLKNIAGLIARQC